jgi:hypothetical protein
VKTKKKFNGMIYAHSGKNVCETYAAKAIIMALQHVML